LVDDEADIVTILKRSLQNAGFEVHAYTDPIEAFEKYAPNYYDLLIFDFKMQKLNGFELYQKIRQIDNNNNNNYAKVCFLSADETHYKQHQESMPQLSADHFLHKPIALKDFVNSVKKLLLQ
jgi:DNA-binding response OmpR family regulator